MKASSTTLILSLLLNAYVAQNDWTTYPSNSDTILIKNIKDSSFKDLEFNSSNNEKSQLVVVKDNRIDLLQQKLKKEKNISGFTVQLEVSQQTNVIKDARLKFIKAFPDHPIFDEYIAPNTYLFAGRFYDKNDALAFQHKIKAHFLNTMVVKKRIVPPNITD